MCESGICLQCWGVYGDKFRKLARLYLLGTREFVALQNDPTSSDPLHNSPYLSQFSVSLERLEGRSQSPPSPQGTCSKQFVPFRCIKLKSKVVVLNFIRL